MQSFSLQRFSTNQCGRAPSAACLRPNFRRGRTVHRPGRMYAVGNGSGPQRSGPPTSSMFGEEFEKDVDAEGRDRPGRTHAVGNGSGPKRSGSATSSMFEEFARDVAAEGADLPGEMRPSFFGDETAADPDLAAFSSVSPFRSYIEDPRIPSPPPYRAGSPNLSRNQSPSPVPGASGAGAVTEEPEAAAELAHMLDWRMIWPELDAKKEQHREMMQNIYTHEDWKRHRSTGRYLRHFMSMAKSRIVYYLFAPSAFITSFAVLIGVYNTLRIEGIYDLPDIIPDTGEVLRLMVTALSLLLVFRTNASYSRWLDARKMWGVIVNRQRDLARQAQSCFKYEDDKLAFRGWLITLPHAIRVHLTGAELTESDLEFLSVEDRELLLKATHKPLLCMQALSDIAHEAGTTDNQRGKIDENLTYIEDAIGGCERILRSPIPLAYTRHTSRMLILWLLQLPMGLWHSIGWDCVPASFIISFFVLGIEEIGVLIEEPFTLLPLTTLCHTVRTNVCEIFEYDRDAFRRSTRRAREKAKAEALAQVQNGSSPPSA